MTVRESVAARLAADYSVLTQTTYDDVSTSPEIVFSTLHADCFVDNTDEEVVACQCQFQVESTRTAQLHHAFCRKSYFMPKLVLVT